MARRAGDRRALPRLRARRVELGLTLDEVAERAGSHASLLSRIERGDGLVRVWLQEQLASTLMGRVEELFAEVGRRGRVKGRSPVETRLRREREAELYRAGESIAAIAARFKISASAVAKDLDVLGVERRPVGGRPKYEPVGERVCELGVRCLHAVDDEPVRFTPLPRHAARGLGRFCSADCFHESRRLHPIPHERRCLHCKKRFRPKRPSDAAGGLGHRGKFCSSSCWSSFRFRRGIHGADVLLNPTASGPARQRILSVRGGIRAATAAGRVSGRKPVWENKPKETRRLLDLRAKHPKWGRPTLVRESGLTEGEVRMVLENEARARLALDVSPSVAGR